MSQSVEWEWLVHDNSPEPSAFMQALCATDPRVRYFHSAGERQSIGWKRNLLIGEARAPLIAHFDDDDYYAPHYLADMIRIMRENDADLIKLSEFYLYAPGSAFFGYMDLNAKTGLHFALAGSTVESIEFHDKMKIGADFVLFYGFSYIYKKPANASFLFDDISLCEDESFIRKLVSSGAKVIAIDDRTASCLHLVHPRSTSRCFARYTMPPFLLPRLFPGYGGFPGL
ncbi:glycosyltransferase [Caballeronia sp. BR00000012568055]|uniref:glycosyltransferase family 2 protein n=1 Tax=Caballeronia sp. BR00000012568055 TaxID=2918761 RepID=UPI0023F7A2E5|nr:glycosyltransferase [Caballeronia sp. BR00000012568055]